MRSIPAGVPEDDLVARMFRLPPLSPEELWGLAAVLVVLVASALTPIIFTLRTAGRRRGREEEEALRRLLERACLDREEERAFREVARRSGCSSTLVCATTVEAFDRGVERLLDEEPVERRQELLPLVRRVRLKLRLHPLRRGPIRSSRSIPRNQPLLVLPRGAPPGSAPLPATLLASTEETLTVLLGSPPGEARATLRDAQEVEVIFFCPGDAAYSFRAPVVALRELDALFLLLRHPAEVVRTQSRQDLRVEAEEAVRFRVAPRGLLSAVEDPLRGAPAAAPEEAGTILNISAGGMRLRTEAKLVLGDFIVLALPFLPRPFSTELCAARVVRMDRASGAWGLRFEGLRPKLQGALLQWVRGRERQRERQIEERLETAR